MTRIISLSDRQDTLVMEPLSKGVALLPGLFSAAECHAVVQAAEARGFSPTGGQYPAGYRNNDRLVVDDDAAAAALWTRLARHLGDHVDAEGRGHEPVGLNPRFRLCRYRNGQQFCRHRDGAFVAGTGRRTYKTVQVYLNSLVDESGKQTFAGGRTRFYAAVDSVDPDLAVVPVAGAALVFDHDRWHDGEAVVEGTKVVLRTDVLYAAKDPVPAAVPSHTFQAHDGYGWDLVVLDDDDIVTCGRDGTVARFSPTGALRWRRRLGRESMVRAARVQGDVVALGSRAGELVLVDGHGEVVARHALAAAVTALSSLPDGAAFGLADGTVGTVGTGGALQAAVAHPGFVHAVVGVAGGLVSSGADGTLRRTSWSDKTSRTRLVWGRGSPITALQPDGHGAFVIGTAAGQVGWLHPADGALTWSPTTHRGPVTGLVRCGAAACTTGEDGVVRAWAGDRALTLDAAPDMLRAVRLTADGSAVVVIGYDGLVRRCDLSESRAQTLR